MKGKYAKYPCAVHKKAILILLKLMEMAVWILKTGVPYFCVIFKFVGLAIQLCQYTDCPRGLIMVAAPKFHSGKSTILISVQESHLEGCVEVAFL